MVEGVVAATPIVASPRIVRKDSPQELRHDKYHCVIAAAATATRIGLVSLVRPALRKGLQETCLNLLRRFGQYHRLY